MTKEEYIEATRMLFNEFITPFYVVLGGIAAVAVIAFAIWFIISPFIRRV